MNDSTDSVPTTPSVQPDQAAVPPPDDSTTSSPPEAYPAAEADGASTVAGADAAAEADGPGGTVRRQPRAFVYGAVALGLVVALGAGFALGRGTAPSGSETGTSTGTAQPDTSGGPDLPSDGNRLGNADAKVVVDYWADYQCPFCSKFAAEVIPALESRIADGTVRLVHRDFAFLGPESFDAAVAVRCAGREGLYWPMHDAVYAAQQGENQGAFSRTRLASIAAGVGLDADAFAACLDERAPLVEVLDDTSAGVRSGVQSTPTVDVNGNRFVGIPDMDRFLAAIDEAAAGASPSPPPTAAPTTDPWSGIDTVGRTAGSDGAPVTVELWMDYQSGDAAVVANELGPELRTRIESGAIRVEQRDAATLGDESVLAATYVACVAAQDGPAWFVHDVLSVSARGAGSGIYTPANLLRLGAQLGLDIGALDACLEDDAVEAAVKAQTAAGAAAGVTAAPVVIVRKGDEEVGRFAAPLDVSAITEAIDAAK